MKFKKVLICMLTASMAMSHTSAFAYAEQITNAAAETETFFSGADDTAENTEATADYAASEDLLPSEDITENWEVLPEDFTESNDEISSFAATMNGTDKASDDQEKAIQGPLYVLMNIPYDKFYASEGIEGVDAVTSATKQKTRTAGLSGGSYHQEQTGDHINGVIYPVKVNRAEDLNAYTKLDDNSSVSITTTNRGQTSTADYTGRYALYESADYSYYILSDMETPAYYKELTMTENGPVFGKDQGNVSVVQGVSAEISYGARHANIEMKLTGTTGIEQGVTDVSGVILTTNDGKEYALRHVVNIWRQTELGWNTNELDLAGKTITNIRYITKDSIIDYPVSISIKTDKILSDAKQEKNELHFAGVPEDATAAAASISYTEGTGRTAKTVEVAKDIKVENGTILLPEGLEDQKVYSILVSTDQYWFNALEFTYTAVTQEEPPKEEDPKAEDPKTEDPKTEDPKTEDPKAEEPKAEDPKAEDPKAEDPKAEDPKTEKQPEKKKAAVMLRTKAASRSASSIKLSWNKVKTADGYLVYGSTTNKNAKMKLLAKTKKTNFTHSKLKKNTYYTYRVVAYKNVNGKRTELSKTYPVYCKTKGGNKTNYTKITLKTTKKTLKAGKTFTLKATLTKDDKNKKVEKKAKLKYDSSNKKIARVSSSGKITAVKKGTCYIYVTTQEGLYAKCKITVK